MRKILLLLIATSIWIACADKQGPSYNDTQVTNCYIAMDYKYEDLLTKADIAKHVNIDESSYKMIVSPIKGPYGSCSYEWLSDRPDLEIEVSGMKIKGPDKNRVNITQLDFYTGSDGELSSQASALALFDQSYKKLTQQEYNDHLASLKKEYANDPVKFDQAKGFLDARMNLSYELVDQLGDRSYWKWDQDHGIELVVLIGATRFTIETKVTAEALTSLDVAVNFAKEVLAKCNG